MLPRSYTKLNETVFDIYLERSRLHWSFKAFATLSTWLALAGYVVFALVFTATPDNLLSAPTVLTTLAGVALLIGYVGIVIIGFLCHSLLFTFDDLLIPTLFTSVTGIFITAMNQGLHKTFDISTQAYIYVPLGTACATTLVTTVLSTIVYFQLRRIKDVDERRRVHVPLEQYPYNVSSTGIVKANPAIMDFMPDDEAQRRQLLRLLIAKDGPPPMNLDDNGSTYKIDLPGSETEGRQRSGSMPDAHNQSRWSVPNLIPKRNRSDTSDTFKDPRERRREEIERSTLLAPNPSYGGHGGAGSAIVPVPAWASQQVRYG